MHIHHFLTHELWARDLDKAPRAQRMALQLLRLALAVAFEFRNKPRNIRLACHKLPSAGLFPVFKAGSRATDHCALTANEALGIPDAEGLRGSKIALADDEDPAGSEHSGQL